jgi:hypothetical protein
VHSLRGRDTHFGLFGLAVGYNCGPRGNRSMPDLPHERSSQILSVGVQSEEEGGSMIHKKKFEIWIREDGQDERRSNHDHTWPTRDQAESEIERQDRLPGVQLFVKAVQEAETLKPRSGGDKFAKQDRPSGKPPLLPSGRPRMPKGPRQTKGHRPT